MFVLLPERQGQNLALCVLCSPDSGCHGSCVLLRNEVHMTALSADLVQEPAPVRLRPVWEQSPNLLDIGFRV